MPSLEILVARGVVRRQRDVDALREDNDEVIGVALTRGRHADVVKLHLDRALDPGEEALLRAKAAQAIELLRGATLEARVAALEDHLGELRRRLES